MAAAAVTELQQKLPMVRGARRGVSDAQYFSSTTKNETLLKQLDSDSMSLKLEAMKKIIAHISKGRDVSEFLPAVVKNVVSQSLELKKLVYLYLIHYAEDRDEVLLSIAHFQKDMTDKSQHIRALSLRVLSSIRLPIIVQIVLLAIRKCVSDSSPWVRKAAALAVPKMYRLNRDEKPQLIGIIDTLLGDSSALVLGAAAHAFNETCPERTDLLHKHYRKIVGCLLDIDEWGQVAVLDTLLRYARTQFLSPFQEGYKKKVLFYGGGSDSEESTAESDDFVEYDMDPDHRLLLKSVLPLLQSQNHAVVMSVASLYFHLAPPQEFTGKIARALLRVAKSSREKQYVALLAVHSMASKLPGVFRPFFKEFFATTADPSFVFMLKIDILALLADSSNVSSILREFKVYAGNSEERLLVHTVRALGRVAFYNSDVADTCLAMLTELTTHTNSVVVAESVVIMRHLLQKTNAAKGKTVARLCRLLSTMKSPVARSSIVWLVGEYAGIHPVTLTAPDTFRTLVRDFVKEEEVVKQQILILGVKLLLHNYEDPEIPVRIKGLFAHAMRLARYDESYNLRDRARMIQAIMDPENEDVAAISRRASEIFAIMKKDPDFRDPGQGRSKFKVGSLSHVANHSVPGYIPLPDFPKAQPDPDARNVRAPSPSESTDTETSSSSSFYSSTEESGSDESDSSDASSSDDDRRQRHTDSSDETESDESETESSSESSEEVPPPRRRRAEPAKQEKKKDEKPAHVSPRQTKQPASPKHVDPVPTTKKAKAKEIAKADLLEFMADSEGADNEPTPPPAPSAEPEVAAAPREPEVDMEGWRTCLTVEGKMRVDVRHGKEVEEEGAVMTETTLRFTNLSEEEIGDLTLDEESADTRIVPFDRIASLGSGESTIAKLTVEYPEPDEDGDIDPVTVCLMSTAGTLALTIPHP
eukprot:Sspe_Gene.23200::Locus_8995_Transcript_1_1_Confidence_1.000_Length_2929::g.23200::m.23200/K12397/AP3B; AP-3 complex subunit beta